MSKEFIKCPICATLQPSEVDFCVYCNTLFNKDTIKVVLSDKISTDIITDENEKDIED